MKSAATSAPKGHAKESPKAPARPFAAAHASSQDGLAPLGNQAIQQLFRSGALRAKLAVGAPDDPLEREADEVADRVMRAPSPRLQRKCDCHGLAGAGGECEDCRNKQEQAGEPPILRRAAAADGPAEAPSIVHETLGSAGRPLDSATRAHMEGRFGADFGDVRTHTDSRAAESTRAVGALAYAVGDNIVFDSDRYEQGSESGRRLLAHELTHVLQQDSRTGTGLRRQSKPDAAGADADSDGLPADPTPASEAPKPAEIQIPHPMGESLGEIDGISLVEDRDFMFAQLERLAVRNGTAAPSNIYAVLANDIADEKETSQQDPRDIEAGAPTSSDTIAAKERVLSIVGEVNRELEQMRDSFLAEFEQRARAAALNILKKNELEARGEAFKYGVDAEKATVQRADCLAGDCKEEVTRYSMGESSPEVSNLQAEAKILLTRRRAFDAAKKEAEATESMMMDCDYGCDGLDDRLAAAQEEMQKALVAFQLPLGIFAEPVRNSVCGA